MHRSTMATGVSPAAQDVPGMTAPPWLPPAPAGRGRARGPGGCARVPIGIPSPSSSGRRRRWHGTTRGTGHRDHRDGMIRQHGGRPCLAHRLACISQSRAAGDDSTAPPGRLSRWVSRGTSSTPAGRRSPAAGACQPLFRPGALPGRHSTNPGHDDPEVGHGQRQAVTDPRREPDARANAPAQPCPALCIWRLNREGRRLISRM